MPKRKEKKGRSKNHKKGQKKGRKGNKQNDDNKKQKNIKNKNHKKGQMKGRKNKKEKQKESMNDVIKRGYLKKVFVVDPQWMVLKNDNKLYVFKDKEEEKTSNPIEIIDLNKCQQIKMVHEYHNIFSFKTEEKEFIFIAPSTVCIVEWIKHIEDIINSSNTEETKQNDDYKCMFI